MTTTMIGLEDIAAISTAEEGRAVALALFNQLPRWTEITDDPDTWPPIDTWVLSKDRPEGEEFLFYRKENGKEYYITKVCRFPVEQQGESFAHWRPI